MEIRGARVAESAPRDSASLHPGCGGMAATVPLLPSSGQAAT